MVQNISRSKSGLKGFSRRSVLKGAAAAGGIIMMPNIVRAQSAGVVNVMGSQNYVPKSVREKFTAETGIQVNFRQGTTDASQIFNLLASEGTRETDMAVLAGHRNFSYIAAGFLEEVDVAMLPNLSKLNPVYLNQPSQLVNGKRYGIPVSVGFMLSTFRKSAVPEGQRDNWDAVFGDAHAGRVTWRSGGLPLTLIFYLGIQDAWFKFDGSPQALTKLEDALKQVVSWVGANKQKLRKWYETPAEAQQLFYGNEVDAGMGLTDVVMPMVVEDEAEYGRSIPVQGTFGFTMNYSITTGAPHRAETYKFINFLLGQPDINGTMIKSGGGVSTFIDTAAGLTADEAKAYSFTDAELGRIQFLSTISAQDPRFPLLDKYVASLKEA